MFWHSVFIIGAVQGAFIAAVIVLQKHTNRRAARLLSAIVALFVFPLAVAILRPALDPSLSSLLVYLSISVDLALGPLGFLFLLAVLEPGRDFSWRTSLHFLPAMAGSLVWMLAWLLADDPSDMLQSGLEEHYPIVAFVVFKAFIMVAYLLAMIGLLTGTLDGGRRYFAGRRQVSISGLRTWLVFLLICVLLLYSSAVLDHLDVEIGVPSDYLTGLFSSILVFLIAWQLLIRPWVLSIRPARNESEEFEQDGETLRRFLTDTRAWQDPTLQLPELAARLGWSTNHASAVINQGLQSSFYDVLVGYRLDEFERLARDNVAGRSVLELALDSGFNSKASFYRAFRERHDVTPTRFMASNSEI